MGKKTDPRITIEFLAERFPQAFFVDGGRRQPLKVGIFGDLIGAGLKLSNTNIRLALRVYTSSPGYLHVCCEGEARVDLAGDPAGAVTEQEARNARKKHIALEAKMTGQDLKTEIPQYYENKSAPISDAPRPSAGPQRLGLSDLKAAWQRRQRGAA